jgi:shikimate dehydrogenase
MKADRYAVVGNPIAHSKSPQIHAAFARATGERIEYGRMLIPLDAFARTIDEFRASGARGCNVTIPFKGEAFAYATEHSERARLAQAVNTLAFDGARVRGDNTDGAGIVADIRYNLGIDIAGRRVLIAGAGGATRGVIPALLAERPAVLVVANRTIARGEALAAAFGGALLASAYDALVEPFDIVINGTSASLQNEVPPVPPAAFAGALLAYDMMYGRGETPFLARARAHGARRRADGLGMLVEQAAESFFVWRGVRPDTAAVLESLRAAG